MSKFEAWWKRNVIGDESQGGDFQRSEVDKTKETSLSVPPLAFPDVDAPSQYDKNVTLSEIAQDQLSGLASGILLSAFKDVLKHLIENESGDEKKRPSKTEANEDIS